MQRFRIRKFYLGLTVYIILLYMEVVFRLLCNEPIISKNFIYILLFNLVISLFFDLIGRIFNRVTNKILFLINLFLLCLIYNIEFGVYKFFGFYFDTSLLKAAGQTLSFFQDGLNLVINNIFGIILLFLPFIIFTIFNNIILIEHDSKKKIIIKSILYLFSIFSFYLFLQINSSDVHSPYKLYFKEKNTFLSIKTFGVLNSFLLDSYRYITSFSEEIVIEQSKEEVIERIPEVIEYKYNNLDIDFDKLISEEDDKTIISMHKYFQNESGTKQNEYSSYFKGKNLILFMAESFNEIAVRQDVTPTLYKLVNSGFKFNNFYTPTISSTIGGEYQELTGLVAKDFVGKWKSGTNSFPFGIATSFKKLNYNTFAYHNNSVYFQNRNKYLASLGFDNFKGCNNGLETLINCKTWPQSDLEMINATVSDYINSDKPFFVYYVTVSGHLGYTFATNAQAKKHKDEVKDLNYSEKALAYLATQIELDKALESLINELDKSGKLDDTVIALVGDHYPYGLDSDFSIDTVNELSSYKKDKVVSVNKSNFILWNNSMNTVEVDKVGSQIDVLPTIYNLFGVSYDSRLIIGKDILSTEPGLAIFGNSSWVSDLGTYYAATGTFVAKGDDVSDDYVEYMNNIVKNKMIMSGYIINNDYYKKVEDVF